MSTTVPEKLPGKPEKPFKHGTVYGYDKRKCRCRECTAASSRKLRDWNRARSRRVRELEEENKRLREIIERAS